MRFIFELANFGASLPGVYRQCAVASTDFWESYKTVIPSKRHRPVGKETGQTNPIERLNKYLGKINYILASKIVQHFFNVSEEALSVFIGAKFNPFIF
ncbi:hypothetical protein myaer102_54920 [Microcystis viridis NIES-102]|uniref:Transposase n=1 Tax=Microcystis viridis NIES-102 TaxID=213615 RepID=A0A3G9JS28_MICVR|nr:hypothetical protein myaer102_54920 [Microcystis viridis NIES-102]